MYYEHSPNIIEPNTDLTQPQHRPNTNLQLEESDVEHIDLHVQQNQMLTTLT